MKKYWNYIPLIIAISAISCSEDFEGKGIFTSGEDFYFATSTSKWGVNGQNLEIDSINNSSARRYSHQVIPIEGESNLFLEAVMGDDFGDVKEMKSKGTNTRGVLQDEVSKTDGFKLAAYYDENGTERTLIDKKTVIFDHTDDDDPNNIIDYWKIDGDETVYWKLGSQAITSYAWWPTDLNFDATHKKINYEVGTDPVNQKDFLYSYVGPTYYTVKESADLTFHHALTAVQFVMGQGFGASDQVNPGKVTKIELQNLFYKGTFDFSTGTWDVDKTLTRTFVLDMSSNPVSMTEYDQNVVLNPDGFTLLMLPQDLSETPCLAVFTMADGRVFRATLNHGGIWAPGQTVRYKLSGEISNGYIIYASSEEAPYTGGTNSASISVTSYQLVGTDPRPQRWKVTGFSIDNGQTWNDPSVSTWTGKNMSNVSAWITNRDITGISTTATGLDAIKVNLTTEKAIVTSTSGKGEDINKKLQSTNYSGTRDLSLYDGKGNSITRQSANCYIVDGWGTFKFPAAYGSALRGNANTTADYYTASYSPDNFVNYLGKHITNPWVVTDTGKTPTAVKVVWEEAAVAGAITGLSYDSSSKYITFTVPQNKIYQGSAVIGLYDGDYCMWSWHIWFTRAYKDYDNATLGSRTFSPDNLGIVYLGRISDYSNRSVMLRIQQIDDSGNIIRGSSSCKITVAQGTGREDNRGMDCLRYQWGRKDPNPCYYNHKRPSYWNPGTAYTAGYSNTNPKATTPWNTAGTQIAMQDAIKWPGVYKGREGSYPNYDWCSTTYHNWWNTKSVSSYNTVDLQSGLTAYVKTVYDPCPAGYHIPNKADFSALVYEGTSYIKDHGLTCRVQGTFKFWAFGHGSHNAVMSNSWRDQYGYLYLSLSYDYNNGACVTMTNTGVTTASSRSGIVRSYPINIRPVKDY